MTTLLAAVCILITIIVLGLIYIILLQMQLRSMSRQLDKRNFENTRQPVRLGLPGKNLSELTESINRSLKAEENLRLETMRREKQFRELIVNISHDLRTPLTAIKGYQQLIEKKELSQEQKIKLQIAQKHADELGNLIEHFFEYAYLLNADLEPSVEKLNLTNLVAECIAESVDLLEEKELTVHFKKSLPVYALADREMTVRILHNLIRNCIVHSAGGIIVWVTANGENSAVITFKNPIDQDDEIDVERLFDRFYIADKARMKTTGLGLSIVKILAEKMGGNTKASLKEGQLEVCVGLPA